MRKLFILSCLSIAVTQAAAVKAQNDPSTQDSTMLRVLEDQAARYRAFVDADISVAGQFLAEDLTYTHLDGTTETKSEVLASLRSNAVDFESMKPRDMDVRIYNDVAIVTGISDNTLVSDGNRITVSIRFIEVMHNAGNRWQLIALQAAPNNAD